MADDDHPAAAPDSDDAQPGQNPAGDPDAAPQQQAQGVSSAGESESDPEPDLSEAERATTYIIQNIATVNANDATFGVGGQPWSRGATGSGKITGAELATRLEVFVEPPGYGRAVVELSEHHLVVILGAEGIGKSLAAMSLLHSQDPTADITTLSPAVTIKELAERKYPAGALYLVRDQLHEGLDQAALSHQLDRLAAKIKQSKAYLVVTADPALLGRREARSWVARWSPPDQVSLFDSYFAEHDSARKRSLRPDQVEAARAEVAAVERPQEVLDILAEMVEDPDSVQRSAGTRVATWFDEKPSMTEIVQVTVVAFLGSVHLTVFEHYAHRLKAHLHRSSELTPAVPGWNEQVEPDRRLPIDMLKEVVREGGREIRFAGEAFRGPVLDELHRRYGYSIWSAIKPWLAELCVTESEQVRIQIGAAMALLARRSFAEVAADLDGWANGLVGERMTAVSAISWMSTDQSTARLALKLVIDWSDQRGQRRAQTAAVALSGGLGLSFPAEAVRWLSFMTSRAEGVSLLACNGIGLLAALSTELDAERTLSMLKLLAGQARSDAAAGDVARYRAARNARSVLSRRRTSDGALLPVYLLRRVPASAPALGTLWSLAIAAGPIRHDAIRNLYDTFVALEGEPETKSAIAALGARISSRLRPDQVSRLQSSLRGLARRSKQPPPDHGLVHVLIAALSVAAPTGTF